jgi:hypothetical protein
MNRPRMTSAACGLLRALVARAGNDRILLSDWTTIDWHSLTFSGEKHRAGLVFSGPDAPARVERWAAGLAEADLDLGTSAFLAEIALPAPPRTRDDRSVLVKVEALTIAD